MVKCIYDVKIHCLLLSIYDVISKQIAHNLKNRLWSQKIAMKPGCCFNNFIYKKAHKSIFVFQYTQKTNQLKMNI